MRLTAPRELPLLQATVLPALALLAGAFGLIERKTAYWLAIGIGVVALIWCAC